MISSPTAPAASWLCIATAVLLGTAPSREAQQTKDDDLIYSVLLTYVGEEEFPGAPLLINERRLRYDCVPGPCGSAPWGEPFSPAWLKASVSSGLAAGLCDRSGRCQNAARGEAIFLTFTEPEWSAPDRARVIAQQRVPIRGSTSARSITVRYTLVKNGEEWQVERACRIASGYVDT